MNASGDWRRRRISKPGSYPRSKVLNTSMVRRLVWSVSLALFATAAVGLAQRVVGPDEFDRAMKTIGNAIDGTDREIAAAAYQDAKAQLALARQTLASTRPLWESDGIADAVRMNRESVAALDALDEALSPREVDPAAVAAAAAEVTRTCDACHAMYREGDEQTGYRIKPSSP